jgi:hypothetical protein
MMSYQNDPNINRRTRLENPDRSSTGMWVAGAFAVCLVLGLVLFATTRNTDTAMNERPAPTATTPPVTTGSGASTTGSGASNMPNNPSGTTPQQENNQPAKPPATNR